MRNRIAAVAVLALAACTDPSKHTAEGQKLVAELGPQIAALLKDNDVLASHVKSMPASNPGVADLVAKIAANQDKIAGLKGLVDGFPAKLAAAVKDGKEADVTGLLASFKKDVTEGIAAARSSLTGLAVAFGALQRVKAAEAAVFEKKLPSGFTLKGSPAGIEALLISYIDDASWSADKATWFDFDRLLFKTGSADLDMDKSKEQLGNVAEILKAYPKVNLKVGGYTDSTGSAAANKKLSTDRAKSVVAQLIAMGIDRARLVPEGYGSDHPVCPANDTEECKAKNRRISVRATAK